MFADVIVTVCLLGDWDIHFMHNLAKKDTVAIN